MPYNIFRMHTKCMHLFLAKTICFERFCIIDLKSVKCENWKLSEEKALSLQGKWRFWLCCLLCVWLQPGPWICARSFLHMQSRVAKAHPQACRPLKTEETFPPIDKPGTAYKKARQNMSLCIWIWFIGQLLQINSLSRPDCFTAMSYSLEWQSPLMQMEGDSHPENPLLDVAGQNDGGHSKCYYTGPTQYQGKAPYCVFIHNLDCRLMVDALLAECWERDNLPCMGISIIISWWDAENTAAGQKAKLYHIQIQRPWRSELEVGPRR